MEHDIGYCALYLRKVSEIYAAALHQPPLIKVRFSVSRSYNIVTTTYVLLFLKLMIIEFMFNLSLCSELYLVVCLEFSEFGFVIMVMASL